VVEAVTKAYYNVLVGSENMAVIDRNLVRLDTLLYQTKEMNKAGFVEKLDVDRLQVTYNNLVVEKKKLERLLDLGVHLLKFQMGMGQAQPLTLTDKLADVEVQNPVNTADFNYAQRIEFSTLETQQALAKLDIKNIRAGYLPRLLLVGRYGYNGASRKSFGDLLSIRAGESNTTNRNWFSFGAIGVSLQIPLFDGLSKNFQVQQARLRLQSVENGFQQLRQSIDLQRAQSSTSIANALDVLSSQKENLALATEVARVAKIKYQEGVGSNLEVTTAETELRQAQTNYFNALYDALISKVDYQKATGTLVE